jgi:hypothetical protein
MRIACGIMLALTVCVQRTYALAASSKEHDMPEQRVQLLHPDPSKDAPRIDQSKYDAVRAALLHVIPADPQGVALADLAEQVAKVLPSDSLSALGSVSWYTMAVKFDLEARGLIERVPGAQPPRVRRAQS